MLYMQWYFDDFNNAGFKAIQHWTVGRPGNEATSVGFKVSCDEVALCIATYYGKILNAGVLMQCSVGHWYPNSCAKNDRFQNLTSHYN